MPRQILLTSALPYANGPLHLGHMVEAVQADIWARFQRLRGHICHYICADDAHGTPIMLRAQQAGLTPETLIAQIHAQHQEDFAGFQIAFAHYHITHSPENQQWVNTIYQRLQATGAITRRTIAQAYDPVRAMFLPDRFIKGTCPRCDAPDQYGDGCEQCGATYSPTDLKNPVSVLSGATPVQRASEHLFFQLPHYQEFLHAWLRQPGHVQAEVRHKLDEWFAQGLADWDISRDAPYFGFTIPGETDKYFYVWLDAPIGYIGSSQALCQKRGEAIERYWAPDSPVELHHIIGKDIMYFHALFWPALLHGAELRLPDSVHAHGFLTINRQKMSKSRGTFILARDYLASLNPAYLRYYFAAKLGPALDDLDLNAEDFVQRVNADLIGKFVNIASRCSSFITRHFENRLADALPASPLFADSCALAETIAAHYEGHAYAQALRHIMALADLTNQYVDAEKPWLLAKQPEQRTHLHQVCTLGLNLFRQLCIYLQPVLPGLVAQVEAFLQIPPLRWADLTQPLLGHVIAPYQPLLQRVDAAQVAAVFQPPAPPPVAPVAPSLEPVAPAISYEDFARIDLRIARIIQAEALPEAEKLLKLTLDVGEAQPRTVFAGLKSAYTAEQLTGRLTVVVANLAPRKMRFGVSEGMVLAAGPGGQALWLLQPDSGAQPGMRVK